MATKRPEKQDSRYPADAPRPQSKDELLEMLQAFWDAVPAEQFEKLPSDGAAEHDHYVYGTPKKA